MLSHRSNRRWITIALAAVALSLILGGYLYRTLETAPLEAPLDYTPQVSGNDINLYSRQTYEDLHEQGFQPRSDVESWPFSIPVDWSADPFDDQNWRFQLNAWRGIDPMIVQYEKTGDAAYLQEAIAYMVDWHRFKNENGENRYTWYDMAAGIRAMRLGYVIDQAYSDKIQVEAEQSLALAAMADEHAKRLQEEDYISLGNHGLFQVFGLDILCSVASNRKACENGEQFAASMFNKILEKGFTEEGVHKEHSPYYHYFTTVSIERLNPERLDSESAAVLLSRAAAVQPWLVWPNGDFVEVGDSTGQKNPLSDTTTPSHCLDNGQCFAVGDFTDSGYAVIRSHPNESEQSSMLFVTGMRYSNKHKHADDLSFSLYEHGLLIFVDSGKYGYENDDFRDYVLSAAAHNTVSLQGDYIGPNTLLSSGSFLDPIETSDGSFEISGEINREDLFQQERHIEYMPGERIIISDSVGSETQHDYVSSLHVNGDLEPQITETGFTITLAGGHTISGQVRESDCEVVSVRGEKDPVHGWESTGYLEMRPATTIQARCSGTNRSITWDIALQ